MEIDTVTNAVVDNTAAAGIGEQNDVVNAADLFTPEANGADFLSNLNPDSLTVLKGCICEKAIENFTAPAHFQLMRTGYFCLDKDSTADNIILNRSVSLKDGFRK